MSRLLAAAAAAVVFASASAQAQFVMMPDSTNNRLVLFDPFNGALVNSNYFGLTSGVTPVHAMQVGGEIWISEQLGDRVSRYDLSGSPIGAIAGGLDNLRGMEQVGGTVYVSNGGAGNGSPGANSVVTFNTAGVNTGSFQTTGLVPSPFSVLSHQGGLLVGGSSGNNDIYSFDLAGAPLGVFHNSTALNFVEQLAHDPTGNVLAVGFSSNNVVTLNANTGAILSSFTASGARGVYQLGNGNIMWTSGAGAFVFDVNTGQSQLVYAGGGRYLDDLVIPTPAAASLLGMAGLAGARRRRS